MCKTDETRWDKGLEGNARAIASTQASPLRVLAGPGTGKTFSLMRRVARLLQDTDVNPRKILVCTFTRAAAIDLQQELVNLGVEGSSQVWAGTLHSLCYNILSHVGALEQTQRTPRPLLEFEAKFLRIDLDNPNFGTVNQREKRIKAFSAAWARLQSDDPLWPKDIVDKTFHKELIRWLTNHNAMLIGELVPITLQFLRDNPESEYHSKFDHVIIDEYQDLNKSEQVLLDTLADFGTISVIGDEDQSIYSFKYAHPEGISEFDHTHEGTVDIGLDVCRRCPQNVVKLANSLIYNNRRQQRVLHPYESNPNGEVIIIQWRTMKDEAEGIAKIIKNKINSEMVSQGQVLVLAQRKQFGYLVRDALNNAGILAHSFFHEQALDGDPKRLDNSKSQQAFTLLNLLVNPEDQVALRCWCGFGSQELRKNEWKRLIDYCEEKELSMGDCLFRLSEGEITIPYTIGIKTRYLQLREELAGLEGLLGEELIDIIFPDEEWAQGIRGALSGQELHEADPAKVLEVLKQSITQPELPTDVDFVRVMSLHKAKGLTADMVVIVGCVGGLIPFIDQKLSPPEQRASLEEQRRLFYVAITRPRSTLIISSVTQIEREIAYKMRYPFSSGTPDYFRASTSQFVRELGPTCPTTISGREFLSSIQRSTNSG